MKLPILPRPTLTLSLILLMAVFAWIATSRLNAHAEARLRAIDTAQLILPSSREADLQRLFPDATESARTSTQEIITCEKAKPKPSDKLPSVELPEAWAHWAVRTGDDYLATSHSAILRGALAPFLALLALFTLATLGRNFAITQGYIKSVIGPIQVLLLLLVQPLTYAGMSLHLADGHPLLDRTLYLATHTHFLMAGALLAGALASLERRVLESRLLLVANAVVMVALAIVLLWKGSGPGGTKVVLKTPWVAFQPIEFIRVQYILTMAGLLARCHQRKSDLSACRAIQKAGLDFALIMVPTVVCVLTGFAAHDFGPVLVILLGTACMLTVYFFPEARPFSAIRLGRIDRSVILGCLLVLAGIALAFVPITATVWSRVASLHSPFSSDAVQGSDQLARALQAVATLAGTGQAPNVTNYSRDFLPLFLVTYGGVWFFTVIMGLFLMVVWVGLRAARVLLDLRFESPFSAMLAIGAVTFVGSQTLLSAFGNFGVAPLTGLTLPFFSNGGSSILASYATIGLLASVVPTSLCLVTPTEGVPLTSRWATRAIFAGGLLCGAATLLQLVLIGLQRDTLGPASIEAWQTVPEEKISAQQQFLTPVSAGVGRVIATSPDGNTRKIETRKKLFPMFQVNTLYRNTALERLAKRLPKGTLMDRNGLPLATSRPLTQEEKTHLEELLQEGETLRPYRKHQRYFPLPEADVLVGRRGESYPNAVSAESDLEEPLTGLPVSRQPEPTTSRAWLVSVFPPFIHPTKNLHTTPADHALWEVHRGRLTPQPQDIRLAVDIKLQVALRRALEQQNRAFPSQDHEAADGVILDPQGHLMAAAMFRPRTPEMSNTKAHEPWLIRWAMASGASLPSSPKPPESWQIQNLPLTSATSLGSVIKTAGLFATHIERPDLLSMPFLCTTTGYLPEGSHPRGERIHCLHEGSNGTHRMVVGSRRLIVSCNQCFAHDAVKLGASTYWSYLTGAFGLPKPAIFETDPEGRKHSHALALAGFGQGSGTELTPHQLAVGYHRILNSGEAKGDLFDVARVEGRLVWCLPRPTPSMATTPRAREARAYVKSALRGVVTEGTLEKAKLPEPVFGKTGTPQRKHGGRMVLDSVVVLMVPDAGTGDAFTIAVRGLGRGAGSGYATGVASQIVPLLNPPSKEVP